MTARWADTPANRLFLGTLALALGCLFIEEVFLGWPQTYLLFTQSQLGWQNSLVNYGLTALTLGLWLSWSALALAAPWPLRVLCGVALLGVAAVQFGYANALSRYLSVIDLQTAAFSGGEVWRSAVRLFFNPVMFLPLAVLIGLWLWVRPLTEKPWRWHLAAWAGWALITALVMLGVRAAALPFRPNTGGAMTSFIYTLVDYTLSGSQPLSRPSVSPPASLPPLTHNVVLIVDESIRGDRLSLNGYPRPNTPYLQELQARGLLSNWGVATTGGTCSPIANLQLITGLRPQPNQPYALAHTWPTVFHYAKALGYRTHYFDAQADILWNGLHAADLTLIDNWRTLSDWGPTEDRDMLVARYAHNLITTSTGNFILINKKGVHFLYEDSYPSEAAVWLPAQSDLSAPLDALNNAYDNGILYNVDTFFRTLLPNPERDLQATTVLYTSDHGQTLRENSENWLHCNYTLNEAKVPLAWLGLNPPPPVPGYRASHANLMPTTLRLLGWPETLPHLAPALQTATQADDAPRYFYGGSGDLLNFDPITP